MPPIYTADDHAELVQNFITESEEIFSDLEELLLALEQSPDDEELLHEIFRGAHTVKGNAACLQFDDLTAFAHVVEELLERLREGDVQATASTVSQLLEAIDAMADLAARAVTGNGALTDAQQALMQELANPMAAAHIASASQGRQTSSTHTLRVAIDKLDKIFDLTGEIAVARGHVRQLVASDDSRERILDAVRELDRLSFDLQELVMSARMVPLGPALRPFQRIVRDVAASREKQVALAIEAGEVEVDTTVIEHLKDPITHMLRNAIDHGIEAPETRVANGKSATGSIRITAAHENGGIVIRISDDGKGLDDAAIAQRARELGLDPARAIFEPGFTTAEEVTSISGRGVGMDVVRRNVEALRGTIDVASERGAGTTITIRLPLTVTVIEGFAIAVAGETYVIPIDAVIECREFPAGSGDDAVGVFNVRGEAMPFLRLRELFSLHDPHPAFGHPLPQAGEGSRDDHREVLLPRDGDKVPLNAAKGRMRVRENVVVVQHDRGRAGIVVDELLGASETVMKPLGGMLRQMPGVSGSSILGSGRVALVLDAREIVRRAADSQLTEAIH